MKAKENGVHHYDLMGNQAEIKLWSGLNTFISKDLFENVSRVLHQFFSVSGVLMK